MRYFLKNCLEELWEQLKYTEWNYIIQVITRTDKAIFFQRRKSELKASILEKWDLGHVPHVDSMRH